MCRAVMAESILTKLHSSTSCVDVVIYLRRHQHWFTGLGCEFLPLPLASNTVHTGHQSAAPLHICMILEITAKYLCSKYSCIHINTNIRITATVLAKRNTNRIFGAFLLSSHYTKQLTYQEWDYENYQHSKFQTDAEAENQTDVLLRDHNGLHL